MPCIPLL
jgi:hypothetical protein